MNIVYRGKLSEKLRKSPQPIYFNTLTSAARLADTLVSFVGAADLVSLANLDLFVRRRGMEIGWVEWITTAVVAIAGMVCRGEYRNLPVTGN